MLRLRRLRYLFKMSLAVSLRRALLVLLSGTVFVLTVLYWNQSVIKTQIFTDAVDNTRAQHSHKYPNEFPIPVEQIWTYKCENERCVRYNYYGKGPRRVSFMSCSMTCGDINIWPHPTIKSLISAQTLRFGVDDVQLRMDSPYSELRKHFQLAFELFVKNLRQIQRVDYAETVPTSDEDDSAVGGGAGAGAGAAVGDATNQRRRHADYASKGGAAANEQQANVAAGGGGNGGVSAAASSMSLFMNALGVRRRGDIDALIVRVSVHKFADMDLSLDTDESYQLTSSFDKKYLTVHITANTYFGARHALSTLQQLIWYDDEDHLLHTYVKSVVSDAPKFRYRGLMLDTARHFFSVASIKRTIAAMAMSKLNRFHWHLTDAQSFPYLSKSYPQLAKHGAYSKREMYSAADIREVSDYARLHGIQVITEIDAPAHAGNGWDWGPRHGLGELSLCINQQPWSFYCGEPPCGQLNPKNNNTYLILQRLYEELVQLSGTTDFFHLGGDEVNLECWAQYFNDTDLRGLWCDFMLNALTRLKVANNNVTPKVVAVWSSALTNTKCLPSSQFAVQIWGGSTWQENYDLIDNGFNVIFSHVDAWYLDCGFGSWRSSGDGACTPYRTWQTVYKHRPWERMRLDKTRKKQVLGGEVCLWTEQVAENQLDNRLWPRSAALGERLWSDPADEHDFDVVSPEVFRRMTIQHNRLLELNILAEAIFPKYCAQNPGECI